MHKRQAVEFAERQKLCQGKSATEILVVLDVQVQEILQLSHSRRHMTRQQVALQVELTQLCKKISDKNVQIKFYSTDVKFILWLPNQPVRLPSQSGRVPLMLQFAMKSASKFTSADKHDGSGSDWKLLPPVYSPRLSSFRLMRLLSEFGTEPVNWFPNNCSSSNPTNLPISLGMRPVKPQRQMHKRRSVCSEHSSFGIVPIKPAFLIINNFTNIN